MLKLLLEADPRCPLPQWNPILSFSHTFLPKAARVASAAPNGIGASPTGNPGSAAGYNNFQFTSLLAFISEPHFERV